MSYCINPRQILVTIVTLCLGPIRIQADFFAFVSVSKEHSLVSPMDITLCISVRLEAMINISSLYSTYNIMTLTDRETASNMI